MSRGVLDAQVEHLRLEAEMGGYEAARASADAFEGTYASIARMLGAEPDEIVLAEGNVQTAESLLIARALMNPVVYNHHVARISKSMLRRATERLLDATGITARELRRMDDHDLHAALRGTPETADAARRIADRRLFKRAIWAEMADVPDDLLAADHEAVRELEADVAGAAGVDREQVVIDVPPRPRMKESSARVLVRGEVHRLEAQSALVEALRTAQVEQWRLGVYTTPELVEVVGQAAERSLGLSTGGRLITERQGRFVPLDEFEGAPLRRRADLRPSTRRGPARRRRRGGRRSRRS